LIVELANAGTVVFGPISDAIVLVHEVVVGNLLVRSGNVEASLAGFAVVDLGFGIVGHGLEGVLESHGGLLTEFAADGFHEYISKVLILARMFWGEMLGKHSMRHRVPTLWQTSSE
jgi:hypothetical protein